MRLNSPIGILLLIWPPFWVIVSLNNGNIYDLITLIFLIGVVTTRTIGCVINDFFDKNFDKNVSRTSNRPYAANLVNKKEVFLIFFILAAINLTLLFFLNLKTIYIGCIAIIFISIEAVVTKNISEFSFTIYLSVSFFMLFIKLPIC